MQSKALIVILVLMVGVAIGSPVVAESGVCRTQGYWQNHPEAWPVESLTLGGVTYDQGALLSILNSPTKGDASLILAHQLIAAQLNIASGAASSTEVDAAVADADAWLAANSDADGWLPYKVKTSSTAGQEAVSLSETLDDFNNGLDAAACAAGDSELPPPPEEIIWE